MIHCFHTLRIVNVIRHSMPCCPIIRAADVFASRVDASDVVMYLPCVNGMSNVMRDHLWNMAFRQADCVSLFIIVATLSANIFGRTETLSAYMSVHVELLIVGKYIEV